MALERSIVNKSYLVPHFFSYTIFLKIDLNRISTLSRMITQNDDVKLKGSLLVTRRKNVHCLDPRLVIIEQKN